MPSTIRGAFRRVLKRRLPHSLVFAAVLGIGLKAGLHAQAVLAPESVQADFDALWRYVADNYAYFDSRLTDWASVPNLYRSDLAGVKTRSELIAVFERVLDELHDAHAQLTVNTASSPRIVPSGADIWAEWEKGQALVREIRAGSDAERSGMRPGSEILAVNEVPIEEATKKRIGRSPKAVDDRVRSWALRAVLAGRHNEERRIRFRSGRVASTVNLPAGDQLVSREGRLSSRTQAKNVGCIRLHDSLGDEHLIAEFDAALAGYEKAAGLVLDLRDTPGGGNSTVARAILGRFVRAERPYQKHLLPSEERETGVRRSWLELVTPRGRSVFPGRVVVLVGHWTGSMGEGLAIGFDAAQAAAIVGTPMAQLLGATYHFELPQSHIGLNIPTEKLFHVNGTPREAFVPAVPVTLEDLAEPDADPWMKKAMQILVDGRRLGSVR